MARALFGVRAKAALVGALITVSLGAYTWWQYGATQREMALLRTAIQNLKSTYPLARIVVVDQTTVSGDQTKTRVRVVFVNEEGQRRGAPIETTLDGSMVYFEALLMIFHDPLVEKGERKTLAFPTRLFTEEVPPIKGEELDVLDEQGVPVVYEQPEDKLEGVTAETYRQILRRFWYYANHPEEADRYGIKVLQGQAVFTNYQLKRFYTISVEADGGLLISPEDFWLEE